MAIRLNLMRVRILNVSYFVVLLVCIALFVTAIVVYGVYKNALLLGMAIFFFLFALFSGVFIGVNMLGNYLKAGGIRAIPVAVDVKNKVKPKPEVKVEVKPEPKAEVKVESDEVFLKKLGKRYPVLPEQREKRMQLVREIGKHLQASYGTFTLSQLLAVLVKLYPDDLGAERGEILDELKEWVSEDAYTQLVKKQGDVSYYELIS